MYNHKQRSVRMIATCILLRGFQIIIVRDYHHYRYRAELRKIMMIRFFDSIIFSDGLFDGEK